MIYYSLSWPGEGRGEVVEYSNNNIFKKEPITTVFYLILTFSYPGEGTNMSN